MGLFKSNIEKMRAKNDVKNLIKALKSNDLRVAGAVEYALEDIGCRTSEPFIEVQRDKEAIYKLLQRASVMENIFPTSFQLR